MRDKRDKSEQMRDKQELARLRVREKLAKAEHRWLEDEFKDTWKARQRNAFIAYYVIPGLLLLFFWIVSKL